MTADVSSSGGKEQLASIVKRVKAMADEIKEIQADISAEIKEARDIGYDGTKIREVVRWLQRIDKHGREKVDEAEAIFDLYRNVVDSEGKPVSDMVQGDQALVAMFAGDDQTDANLSRRRKGMRTALTMARAAKQARNS